jgi:hypothetical protein
MVGDKSLKLKLDLVLAGTRNFARYGPCPAREQNRGVANIVAISVQQRARNNAAKRIA